MFMRKLQVYHGSSCELSGQVWNESHRNTMSLHDKEGCRESTHPTKAGCARNQESERDDTRGGEQHVCSHASTGKSQGHAQSMYDWQTESTC